ncbi:MAG TPA: histidine triad nucleotide-binding protein [Anaerolineales bacterium]
MSTDACVFCQIARGQTDTAILYRDDDVVVFRDIRPVAPLHLLVIPRRHVASLLELQESDEALISRMISVARDLAVREGVEAGGYRLVMNTGPDAGQTVFHLHMHLLAGRQMHWPPG